MPPRSGDVISPRLEHARTVPIHCPMLSEPTVSTTSASPTVQTIAADTPWRYLLTTRIHAAEDNPKRRVAPKRMKRPTKYEVVLSLVRSEIHPHIAELAVSLSGSGCLELETYGMQ